VGQKVHPLGFRLVTTQKCRSTWYSEFANYPTFLKEDFLIRSFIEKREKEAAISKVEIKRNSKGNKIEVEIHSGRPGILVGHKGTELTKIYKNLRDITSRDEFGRKDSSLEKTIIVNIVELSSPDCEANLIADFIVEQLEKRVAFRRAIKKAIKRTQVAKVEGIKVQVSGRLNGAEIARAEWIREGRVPLQTLRADIDYAEKQAHTIYGVLGIKVWLFKGEII
jgi:small subunit ribosomal protein S3|tara:strand:+ start:683 stop:1351 length:669 start_codon:yes stop_codon:yes gene_type:complete